MQLQLGATSPNPLIRIWPVQFGVLAAAEAAECCASLRRACRVFLQSAFSAEMHGAPFSPSQRLLVRKSGEKAKDRGIGGLEVWVVNKGFRVPCLRYGYET